MLFVFTIAAFVQISLWFGIRIGLRRAARSATDRSHHDTLPSISVVIPARDGADDLAILLPLLEQQQGADFEVIVVDDGSVDGSSKVVEPFAQTGTRFRALANPPSTRGKKGAVRQGIAASRHDVVVQTDVDCRPGPGWLRAHAEAHVAQRGVVVGYAPYTPTPTPLNSVVRFETLSTAMLTATAVGLGHPYMAVGRNLSYAKVAAETVESLQDGSDLLSGDDDLFVQAASRAGFPVSYLFDASSFVQSRAPASLGAWIRQKRRHFSAGRAYSKSAQLGLGLFHLSSLVCWAAPFVAGWAGLAVLAAKFAIQWPTTVAAAKTFRERGLTAGLPLFDLGWQMLVLLVGSIGVLFPPKKW